MLKTARTHEPKNNNGIRETSEADHHIIFSLRSRMIRSKFDFFASQLSYNVVTVESSTDITPPSCSVCLSLARQKKTAGFPRAFSLTLSVLLLSTTFLTASVFILLIHDTTIHSLSSQPNQRHRSTLPFSSIKLQHIVNDDK
jgi:hypothetical protein